MAVDSVNDRRLAEAGDDYTDKYLPDWVSDINLFLANYGLHIRQLLTNSAGIAAQVVYRQTSYTKYYMTPFQATEEELYRLVYETIEILVDIDEDERMNIFSSALFPYLSGEMIGDGEVTLTIKDVVMEKLSNGKTTENKPVVKFKERDKGWVLNKSNAKALAEKLGAETDNWRGSRVVLHAPMIEAFGKQMRSVRAKKVILAAKNGSAGRATAPPREVNDDFLAEPEAIDEQAVTEAVAVTPETESKLADLRASLEESDKPKVGDVIAAVNNLTGIDAQQLLARASEYDEWPKGKKVTPAVTLSQAGAVKLYDWLAGVTLFEASEEEE